MEIFLEPLIMKLIVLAVARSIVDFISNSNTRTISLVIVIIQLGVMTIILDCTMSTSVYIIRPFWKILYKTILKDAYTQITLMWFWDNKLCSCSMMFVDQLTVLLFWCWSLTLLIQIWLLLTLPTHEFAREIYGALDLFRCWCWHVCVPNQLSLGWQGRQVLFRNA